MNNEHVSEAVNLAECPEVSERAGKQNEITIGDLHGNGLKLLYFLVREGVIDITKQGYEIFYEIYKKMPDQITKTDIIMLNLSLTLATVNPNPPKVRLIGDELFDRGSNDYFVLKLFEKLGESNVPLEILASNHGFEYLRAAEKNLPEITTDTAVYLAGGTPFRRSYTNLITLKNKLGSELGDLMELTNKFYKPNLKMLSYTLDEERNAITLYMHAPVFLDTITKTAKKFSKILTDDIQEVMRSIAIAKRSTDTAADDKREELEKKIKLLRLRLEKLQNITFEKGTSAKALAKIIDSINEVFAYHVETNRTADLFSQDTDNDPVFRMIWNRYDDRNEYEFFDTLDFAVLCVHGHDGNGNLQPGTENYIVNLDNELGKDSPSMINTRGIYTILSTSPAPQLEEQLSEEALTEGELSVENLSDDDLLEEVDIDHPEDLTAPPLATIYLKNIQTAPYLRDDITNNYTVIDFMMNHTEVENIERESDVTILLWDKKPVFKIYDDHICLMDTGTKDEDLPHMLSVLADLFKAISNDHGENKKVVTINAQTSALKTILENALCENGHIVESRCKENDLQQTQTRIIEPLIDDFDTPPSRPPPTKPISH